MPLQPPPALIELLERLGVTTNPQILRAGRRIKRFARDLQQFDSVWVDVLVRARRLTPFQAREINAGRGEELKIGPYLLCEKLAAPPYLLCYRAKHRESGSNVRLAVQCGASCQVVDLGHTERQVGNLSYDSGVEGNRRYFASPWIVGRTIGEWLNVGGRFPPESVLEIARSMVAKLATLEKSGRCHGDIAPWNILLTSDGELNLLNPGLRELLRPEEGFAFADLLPEAYDYLAPERVIDGSPPKTSSDIYACGCVWWQMLCGRPPLGGGDSLAKFRAAQNAEIPDVRRNAPETPVTLAEAVSACLHKEPSRRPESFAKLAAMLGPPSKDSRQFVTRSLAENYRTNHVGGNRLRHQALSRNWPVWLVAFVGCASVLLLLLGPMLTRRAGLNPVISSGRENVNDHARSRQPRPPDIISNSLTSKTKTGQVEYHKMQDREVKPAGFTAAEKLRVPRSSAIADYLLETKSPQSMDALSLQRGQRAIGLSGRRATIRVSANGLKLAGEDIRLENIDFLWDTKGDSSESAAILLYSGSRADFRGCRFFTAKGTSARPSVLRWTNLQSDSSKIDLPSGRLQFANCVFHRVGAGIDCRRRGAICLDLNNFLLFETSGLFLINHQHELDEPITINLARFTMLQSGPLFYCKRGQSENTPGEIAIQAENCVFSLQQYEPLLAFEGVDPPDVLLRNIRWNGSDSLLSVETPVIASKTPADHWETLDDTTLSIAGLVRSRLEFASSFKDGAETSDSLDYPAQSARLLNWQAPLPTSDPPGVDGEALPREGEQKD
jgi:eukaryotic-like serine/threonine-protein kinase